MVTTLFLATVLVQQKAIFPVLYSCIAVLFDLRIPMQPVLCNSSYCPLLHFNVMFDFHFCFYNKLCIMQIKWCSQWNELKSNVTSLCRVFEPGRKRSTLHLNSSIFNVFVFVVDVLINIEIVIVTGKPPVLLLKLHKLNEEQVLYKFIYICFIDFVE